MVLAMAFAVSCDKSDNDVENEPDSDTSGGDVVTYTVSYDLNYTGAPDAPATVTVDEGDTIQTAPTIDDREDYIFEGWFINSVSGDEFVFGSTTVTADITLYAKWSEIIYYTVTFDYNDDVTPSTEEKVLSGDKVSSPSPDPTLDGYAFAGWYNGSDLYSFSTAVTSDLTLTAKWSEAYTVTFDSTDIASQSVISGGTATEPTSNPTSDGKTFLGWYADASFSTEYNFSTVITSDTTIYAQWWDNSTTTFDITTLADLKAFRDAVNLGVATSVDANFSGSISLLGINWTPIGSSIYPYTGTFNATGGVINYLTIYSTSIEQGFFGVINGATITGLTINTPSITTTAARVGAIVGYVEANGATIADCTTSNGYITSGAANVGGIAGAVIGYATITNCKNDGTTITRPAGYQNAGGIVGSFTGSDNVITSCSNSGKVTYTETGTATQAGGIAGASTGTTFVSCSNSGTVESLGNAAGGIVGQSNTNCSFEDCSNSGAISGGANVAGIVGQCGSIATFTACYNTGSINATGSAGGLIGNCATATTITGGYNTGTVTSEGNVGGIVGNNGSNALAVYACYNTGTLSTTGTYIGGIFGNKAGTGTIADNYWLSSCGAAYGVGSLESNSGATPVSSIDELNTAIATMNSNSTFSATGYYFVKDSSTPTLTK